MAEEASPLRFPTPREILGENAPSPPPAPAAATAAVPPSERSARPQKHPRRPSTKDNAKRAAQKKDHTDPDPDTDNTVDAVSGRPKKAPTLAAAIKDTSVVKPKQTKSRNGTI